MDRRRALPSALLALLLSAGLVCATPVPLKIERVSPVRGFAPHPVYVLTRIARHADNRIFCVGVFLQGLTVRRSCGALEGENDAELIETAWREPLREPGKYVVLVELYRGTDFEKPVATARAEIILMGAEGIKSARND
jgi:hypothetical protein